MIKSNMAALRRAATTEKMRAAGYYPASEVAERAQVHLGSVYRWIAEGEVAAVKLAGKNYISRASLVQKFGSDAARVFGFVPAAHAAPVVETTIEVEED